MLQGIHASYNWMTKISGKYAIVNTIKNTFELSVSQRIMSKRLLFHVIPHQQPQALGEAVLPSGVGWHPPLAKGWGVHLLRSLFLRIASGDDHTEGHGCEGTEEELTQSGKPYPRGCGYAFQASHVSCPHQGFYLKVKVVPKARFGELLRSIILLGF